MQRVFREYQHMVLAAYKSKMASGDLSSRLINPSPGNLRDECVALCKERFHKKDEKTLRDFFGQQKDGEAYLEVIEHYPLSKFKPLQNFMLKEIETPDERNVELLAWLIDFKPRPWQLGWPNGAGTQTKTEESEQISSTKEKKTDLSEDQPVSTNTKNGEKSIESHSEEEQKRAWWKKHLPTLLLSILLIGATGYVIYINTAGSRLNRREECMYWTGDRYDTVSCSKKMGDTLVVALDTATLRNFKRNTQPDTITHYSVGKVWYVERNGALEFFTTEGDHPEDRGLRLKPLSHYIVNNRLVKKDQ